MENLERKNRCIDIVFCIDGTGSMSDCIENVKSHARNFYSMLVEKMTRLGSDIDETRVKVIVFRDYGYDGENSMQISPFYTLDQDAADYENFLSNVRAQGGGDGPENGLEALYYAMQSKLESGDDDRQVIVLFTDADALELGARADRDVYPKDMVDATGLAKMWIGKDQERAGYLNQLTKRLVIFAPAGTKYEELAKNWNLTWYKAVAGDNGLSEISFEDIIDLIGKSASAKVRK